MDVRLLCVSDDCWAIMVKWRGRVRYRRVGTLALLPGWRWRAFIDDDMVERPRKIEAVHAFLTDHVLGFDIPQNYLLNPNDPC